MSPTIEQKSHCTHIRFQAEDLIHLGQLKNMSLIFKLDNGQYLTLSADIQVPIEPEDELSFNLPCNADGFPTTDYKPVLGRSGHNT